MNKKAITFLETLIIIAASFIVVLFVSLYIFHPNRSGRFFFGLLIFLFIIDHVRETFFSTREKGRKKHRYCGDWTLPAMTMVYIILITWIIIEFFLVARKINLTISLIGILIYTLAYILRYYGRRFLGDQWAVHAIGVSKIRKRYLVKKGLYRYIRHPLYLGIMSELVALPLIFNTFYAEYFSIFVGIPIQLIRTFLEENFTIRKLGKIYIKYKEKVAAFIPIQLLKRKKRKIK